MIKPNYAGQFRQKNLQKISAHYTLYGALNCSDSSHVILRLINCRFIIIIVIVIIRPYYYLRVAGILLSVIGCLEANVSNLAHYRGRTMGNKLSSVFCCVRAKKCGDTSSSMFNDQGGSSLDRSRPEPNEHGPGGHTEHHSDGRTCSECLLKGYSLQSCCHDVPGQSRGPHTQAFDNEDWQIRLLLSTFLFIAQRFAIGFYLASVLVWDRSVSVVDLYSPFIHLWSQTFTNHRQMLWHYV